jgi:hypothetical protein
VNGKLVAGFLVVIALIAGGAMYYLQEYAYYREIPVSSPAAELRLTALDGAPEPIPAEVLQVIDADSSPLRFRGCYRTSLSLAMLTETYRTYDKPTPLIGPRWLTCFDAAQIGTDLELGAAVAFLSQPDIATGVDRVVAVYPDGRAYAWHQLNESADK